MTGGRVLHLDIGEDLILLECMAKKTEGISINKRVVHMIEEVEVKVEVKVSK